MRKIETIGFDFMGALADGKSCKPFFTTDDIERGQRAEIIKLDEVCDFNENDQRHLDNNLIEHYSDIGCSHPKWFNPNTTQYIRYDKRTAYEIDGFDEYSQQPLSEIHMLDKLHDDIYALENLSYKEFMLMTYEDYVGLMNCLRLRVRNMGWEK